jgi:hypothetical protein
MFKHRSEPCLVHRGQPVLRLEHRHLHLLSTEPPQLLCAFAYSFCRTHVNVFVLSRSDWLPCASAGPTSTACPAQAPPPSSCRTSACFWPAKPVPTHRSFLLEGNRKYAVSHITPLNILLKVLAFAGPTSTESPAQAPPSSSCRTLPQPLCALACSLGCTNCGLSQSRQPLSNSSG